MNNSNFILTLTLFFAVLCALAYGLAFVSLRWLKRDQSPFIKIFRDAVDIFIDDHRMVLLPILTMISFCPLFFLVFRYSQSTLSLLDLQALAQKPSGIMVLLGPALSLSIPASCFVIFFDAILADYFLTREHGQSKSLLQALFRVIARVPQLIGFTLLWSGLLVVIALASVGLAGLSRRYVQPIMSSVIVESMILFAEWSIEIGVTMAAYFMLVVMIEEKVGPWKAFLITLEIAREEYGKPIGQLIEIELLDISLLLCLIVTFALVFAVGGYFALSSRTISPIKAISLWLILPLACTLLEASIYYLVFQTLQLLLATAAYLYLKDGILATGFEKDDFDRILCLRAKGLRQIPVLMTVLRSSAIHVNLETGSK